MSVLVEVVVVRCKDGCDACVANGGGDESADFSSGLAMRRPPRASLSEMSPLMLDVVLSV